MRFPRIAQRIHVIYAAWQFVSRRIVADVLARFPSGAGLWPPQLPGRLSGNTFGEPSMLQVVSGTGLLIHAVHGRATTRRPPRETEKIGR